MVELRQIITAGNEVYEGMFIYGTDNLQYVLVKIVTQQELFVMALVNKRETMYTFNHMPYMVLQEFPYAFVPLLGPATDKNNGCNHEQNYLKEHYECSSCYRDPFSEDYTNKIECPNCNELICPLCHMWIWTQCL